jgi:aryl-alcohol dehydrogenase-like predicted oxidoreductase
VNSFGDASGKSKLDKIKQLADFAENGASELSRPNIQLSKYPTELKCKINHLALAWIAKNPNTGTVILGASRPEQLLDNLKAIEVLPKLSSEVMEEIEAILGNKPAGPVRYIHHPLQSALH